MADDDGSDNPDVVHYEGGIPVFGPRLDKVEREQIAAKQRDEHYKDAQLKINSRMALFTGLLVACSLITGGISVWQATIAQTAASAARDAAKAASDNANTSAYALLQNEWTSDFTLQQMESQTAAQQDAASAAKKSASTASDALHVSERAYLIVGAVTLDMSKKVITVPIVNTGRIPSGKVEVVVHDATILAIWQPSKEFKVIEKHWKRHHLKSIPAGYSNVLDIPITETSEGGLAGGGQQVIVAGTLTYNDGFSDTPPRIFPFCKESVYHKVLKEVIVTECDPSDKLPTLEHIDGYPNNEEKD